MSLTPVRSPENPNSYVYIFTYVYYNKFGILRIGSYCKYSASEQYITLARNPLPANDVYAIFFASHLSDHRVPDMNHSLMRSILCTTFLEAPSSIWYDGIGVLMNESFSGADFHLNVGFFHVLECLVALVTSAYTIMANGRVMQKKVKQKTIADSPRAVSVARKLRQCAIVDGAVHKIRRAPHIRHRLASNFEFTANCQKKKRRLGWPCESPCILVSN